MIGRKTVFLIALVSFIAGCSEGPTGEGEIKEAVKDVIAAQEVAWNNGDIEGFMQGYWKSDELSFSSGGKIKRGWETVLEKYRTTYTPEKMGKLSLTDLEITPLGQNSAYVLGTWAIRLEPDNPRGKFTLILRRFPEGWRIVHDHTSISGPQ